MSDNPEEFLHLHAMDLEGLQYISACSQDAIARIADIGYQPRLNRFALVITRFRWERVEARHENSERVRAGLHFETVSHVRTQDIDMSDANGLLPLLAISAEEGAEGVEIKLLFAGGGTIWLTAEVIECQLQDLGGAWHTPIRPDHDLE